MLNDVITNKSGQGIGRAWRRILNGPCRLLNQHCHQKPHMEDRQMQQSESQRKLALSSTKHGKLATLQGMQWMKLMVSDWLAGTEIQGIARTRRLAVMVQWRLCCDRFLSQAS